MEGKPTPINSVAIVQTNTEDIVGELDLVAMTKGVLIEKLAVLRGGPTTLYESWAREFEQRFPRVKVTMKAAPNTPPASPTTN